MYPGLELSKKVSPSRYQPLLSHCHNEITSIQTNSAEAANNIPRVAWEDLLRFLVSDLLHQLRVQCTAFRFLVLPLELREMMYGMAFEESEDPEEPDDCGWRHWWESSRLVCVM